ncbi:MAG: hypothetical protein JKY37_13640, partial [Nannocystaceae bacterium]|nr:hypothetical protein [Nannocystaceae bacterium]
LARQRALLTIRVEPLTLDEVRLWLRGYFGLLRIRPRDVRRIHHASAGNPFALVEVVRDLVDRGTITDSEQGWACEDLYDVAVPDTVHALFRARLDAASPQAQAVLAVACVVGQQFRFETLQVAGEFDELELEEVLEGCVKARILSNRDLSSGADYRFVSEGMRRVLYDGLPPRARKRSHRRVVATLGSLYAEDGETRRLAQVLAYHHRAVGDWPETLHHALIAARDHLASHGHDGAETTLNYAREAVEALDADGRPEVTAAQRAQLLFIQGTLDARIGRAHSAQTELQRAVDAAESIGDAKLVVDALLALAEAHLGRGHFADGVATGMRAIGTAQGIGDRRREFAARIQVARCATPLGRLDDSETILGPVLDASANGLSTTRAFALREMALVHAKRGAFIAAVKTANDALLEANKGGDSLSEYRAVSALGFVHAECGRYEVAVEHLEHALQLARALSLRRREGIELCNLGETMHLAGDTARGLGLVRIGLAIFIEISDGASEGDCRVNIGRMLLALGQGRDAVEMLETGRRACQISGRAEYEGIALCALADLRLSASELLEAHDLFEDARQVLSQHGVPLLWQAELGLARVASRLGHSEVARAHAERARDLVEAQMAEVPPGQRSRGLAAAHEATLRALSDDSPTQTVP